MRLPGGEITEIYHVEEAFQPIYTDAHPRMGIAALSQGPWWT
jgi:hypothetical protein